MNVYRSYSKVNLFLDIVSKYKNGYHGLRSIFIETSLHDIIEYKISDTKGIRVHFKNAVIPDDNLFTKAYYTFVNVVKPTKIKGLDINVIKNIPIGGGLGGGSSNAATILKIMNKITKTGLSEKQLQSIGTTIGADIPFFIKGGIQKVFGTGNILYKLCTSLTELQVVLVFPTFGISTVDAYKKIDENNLSSRNYINDKKWKQCINGFNIGDISEIGKSLYNKFEYSLNETTPTLTKITKDMHNCGIDYVVMSGSGSTMIGLCHNKEKLHKSIANLEKKEYKAMVVSCRF